MPQVWYLDLFAGANDYEAAERGGTAGHKEINRTTLTLDDIEAGLNPLAPGARELIQAMADDVLARMPGVRHFHLGGDEARTFGRHPETKTRRAGLQSLDMIIPEARLAAAMVASWSPVPSPQPAVRTIPIRTAARVALGRLMSTPRSRSHRFPWCIITRCWPP